MNLKLNKRQKNIINAIIAVGGFLLLWEVTSLVIDNNNFLPRASVIIMQFFESFVTPIGRLTMPMHVLYSLYRVLVALAISTVTGILLGVGMGYSKLMEAIFYPIFEFIRPIPPLAWIPMAILWFGLGDASKFFIIFLGCFSFITLNAYDGTKSVDPELIGAAKMLGASNVQIFFKVVLPATVPFIFAGLQTAVTSGWSSVVGAELVRSDEGVGWIINMGMTQGNTNQIMVGMMAIGLVGYMLVQITHLAEGRLLRWQEK